MTTEAAKERRAKNKEYLREYRRAYEARNAEVIREKKKLWKRNNPDRVKAHRAKHSAKNRIRIKELAKVWYEANRERAKARTRNWFLRTRPLRMAARHVTQVNDRASLAAEYGHGCSYCKSQERLEVDHKVPKSRGGAGDRSNLQWLCHRCNRAKHTMTEPEFFAHIEKVLLGRGDHS